MRPTLRDVAQEARVSIKTVSRVLNDEPHVTEEKRRKVFQAVERLGFRPNVQARRLKQNLDRSYLIGLLYDNPTAHYVSRLLVGTLERCDESGYRLAVECVPSEREGLEAKPSAAFLARDDLDGVILTPPLSDDLELVAALEARDLTTIRITPFVERARTPSVFMEDFEAARRVTEHLIALGHRRIAHIMGSPRHGSSEERKRGFLAAMAASELEVPNTLVVTGDYTFAGGRTGAERLLSGEGPRPTAIFAANDEMAIATLFAAQTFNLRVPEDLSVAGFDDLPFASLIEPHLTTIRQPLHELAEAAAGLLIRLKETTDVSQPAMPSIEVPFEFVKRASTGAVPKTVRGQKTRIP